MKFIIAGLGNFYRSWKLAEEAVSIADDLGYYGVVFPDHPVTVHRGKGDCRSGSKEGGKAG
ncbi:MAG: hypothetical protein AUF79_06135 [Crenarchaeota archaeon 13_1_20CM_2_51_8]|nr:MAG: hypothetical protein AUI97_05075 [Crenarchaeota archaeon 13_1_40CM_3_52_17]OLE91171.1 MAG: hypothetical protein AUF79_06135 [Crenarchaeota archaeon 13_1_20CM_2_51_8]